MTRWMEFFLLIFSLLWFLQIFCLSILWNLFANKIDAKQIIGLLFSYRIRIWHICCLACQNQLKTKTNPTVNELSAVGVVKKLKKDPPFDFWVYLIYKPNNVNITCWSIDACVHHVQCTVYKWYLPCRLQQIVCCSEFVFFSVLLFFLQQH